MSWRISRQLDLWLTGPPDPTDRYAFFDDTLGRSCLRPCSISGTVSASCVDVESKSVKQCRCSGFYSLNIQGLGPQLPIAQPPSTKMYYVKFCNHRHKS